MKYLKYLQLSKRQILLLRGLNSKDMLKDQLEHSVVVFKNSHLYLILSLKLCVFCLNQHRALKQDGVPFTSWPQLERWWRWPCGTDDIPHWLCWVTLCCARVHGWTPGLASLSKPGQDFQRLHDEFPKCPETTADETAVNIHGVCTQLNYTCNCWGLFRNHLTCLRWKDCAFFNCEWWKKKYKKLHKILAWIFKYVVECLTNHLSDNANFWQTFFF